MKFALPTSHYHFLNGLHDRRGDVSNPLIQVPPHGIVDGVNVLSASSAIFQLRASGKDYDAAGQLVQPWSSALEIYIRYWLAGTYIAFQANDRSTRFNIVH